MNNLDVLKVLALVCFPYLSSFFLSYFYEFAGLGNPLGGGIFNLTIAGGAGDEKMFAASVPKVMAFIASYFGHGILFIIISVSIYNDEKCILLYSVYE